MTPYFYPASTETRNPRAVQDKFYTFTGGFFFFLMCTIHKERPIINIWIIFFVFIQMKIFWFLEDELHVTLWV